MENKVAKREQIPFTSTSSVTCIGDIFRETFDMLFNRLKDRLTGKLAIFPVISGRNNKQMLVTDLKWLKKIEDFACFQIYGIIKTTLRVIDRLSIVTSGRIN